MTVKDAERIHRATLGFKRFLVSTEGGYRWSDYKEDDKRDDFEPGCPVHASPNAAIFAIHQAAGFIKGIVPR